MNTSGFADLHLHTFHSDGTFSPHELASHAQELGFRAISITDHDTVQALMDLKNSNYIGLEIIPGIELSAYHDDEEVHILGYFIRFEDAAFLERLSSLCHIRQLRIRQIVQKLSQHGIPIQLEEVLKISNNQSPGRLHVARLLHQKKIVSHPDEAFQRFLSRGQIAYVPKEKISTKDAIQMIRSVGGVPVAAHPIYLKSYETIYKMVDEGLMGLEVYHSKHDPAQVRDLLEIASKKNMAVTGGSDCHGLAKGKVLMGSIELDYSYVDLLRTLSKKNE